MDGWRHGGGLRMTASFVDGHVSTFALSNGYLNMGTFMRRNLYIRY